MNIEYEENSMDYSQDIDYEYLEIINEIKAMELIEIWVPKTKYLFEDIYELLNNLENETCKHIYKTEANANENKQYIQINEWYESARFKHINSTFSFTVSLEYKGDEWIYYTNITEEHYNKLAKLFNNKGINLNGVIHIMNRFTRHEIIDELLSDIFDNRT